MKSPRIILIVLFSYLFVGSVYASEGKGLEIATEVDVRDRGFGDTTSTMTMTLFDQYGNSTSRKISCLLYTSPSPRDKRQSRMPSSA